MELDSYSRWIDWKLISDEAFFWVQTRCCDWAISPDGGSYPVSLPVLPLLRASLSIWEEMEKSNGKAPHASIVERRENMGPWLWRRDS